MSDITMCSNILCERREQCHRAMAKPSVLQSYADFGKDCESNNFRNQWEIRKNNTYIDEISEMLERC